MSGSRLVILTGLSGSGKSTAARALEDEGFFVIDNLPPMLLPQVLALRDEGDSASPMAVVIDARNRDFLSSFEPVFTSLRDQGQKLDIYFFDASDETLVRRYSETRRRHPLAQQGEIDEGIRLERRLLRPLRDRASGIIDTTGLNPHHLRAQVLQRIEGERGAIPMLVHLRSFGFRYGIPQGSDLVMDVRFLPNPFFDPSMRHLSGRDPKVRSFVLQQSACRSFLTHFEALLAFLLPQYRREGKSYLTLSIGCTGGRHRSVAIVEHLAEQIAAQGIELRIGHKDIDKGS
ncbi:MAG: RNase adapter RapZ [Desulfuromonas sp.]|nr:MAG: RNase adapter RapZ [Desulfuromonas sp.]